MQASTQTVSPLRQRMIEDMRMRKLAPKTQAAYIRAVRNLAKYLGRSPDTASDEDLRRFQLHLVDQGTSPITLNATIVGLNFLFDVTLRRPEVMARMQSVRVPFKLPVMLSKEEVAHLLAATANIKHQTALSVAYGTGLRVAEVVALKATDSEGAAARERIVRCVSGVYFARTSLTLPTGAPPSCCYVLRVFPEANSKPARAGT